MTSIDYGLCRFRPSSIAVASILLALENRGNLLEFRDSWFQFVCQNFPEIDMVISYQLLMHANRSKFKNVVKCLWPFFKRGSKNKQLWLLRKTTMRPRQFKMSKSRRPKKQQKLPTEGRMWSPQTTQPSLGVPWPPHFLIILMILPTLAHLEVLCNLTLRMIQSEQDKNKKALALRDTVLRTSTIPVRRI